MKEKKIIIITVLCMAAISIITLWKLDIPNLNNKKLSVDEQKDFVYTPLLYKICDDNSCIYLLGSIHTGDDRVEKFSDVIIKAYNDSDILAVELDDQNVEIDLNDFLLDDGTTLTDYISDELDTKLQDFSIKHPMFDYELLKEFKVGYISNYLSLIPYLELGYLESGVDSYFLSLARNDNKEIVELEDYEFQLSFIIGYSDSLYIQQIEYIIDNYDVLSEQSIDLYETYLLGDKDKLKELIDSSLSNVETEEEKQYNKDIYDDRNINMTANIEKFLANDQKVFMVVGSAHVIGTNGIIDLLSEKDYQISIVK